MDLNLPKFFESAAGTDPSFHLTARRQTIRRISNDETARVKKQIA